MAITVQNLVDWARAHTKLLPIVSIGGIANEPGLTIAKDALDKLFSHPYNWKWARVNQLLFNTINNTYDYNTFTVATGTFGWLERAYAQYTPSTEVLKPKYDIQVVQDLSVTSEKGDRPKKIAVNEIGIGAVNDTLVIRTWPAASNTNWAVYGDYQKAPPVITALTSNLSWIPDHMGRVIRQLFLAFAFRFANDNRFVQELNLAEKMIYEKLQTADIEQSDDLFMPDEGLLLG